MLSILVPFIAVFQLLGAPANVADDGVVDEVRVAQAAGQSELQGSC